MDAQMFTALAERVHTDAETNLRRNGIVLPLVLLYNARSEMSAHVVHAALDENERSQLRKAVRAIPAVAAIRIAHGYALRLPAGAHRLPYEDLPRPSEHPDAQQQIVTEARWPAAGIHQIRITAVDNGGHGLVLTRAPGDPNLLISREDLLAQIFPPPRKRRTT